MYALKYESKILRLRHPQTNIGRHGSNHITLTKSLKISRFHAVISFHDGTPLIKDISEWGVFLNNKPIFKNRWAELKLGDVITLGALTVENGGRILEVVSVEPEVKELVSLESSPETEIEVASTTVDGGYQSQVKVTSEFNDRIEIIDITEMDGDDIIDISDDENKARDGSCTTPSQPLSTCHGTNKIEVVLLADSEHSSKDQLIPMNEEVTSQSECTKSEIPLPSVINKAIISPRETERHPTSNNSKSQFHQIKLPNPVITKAAPISENKVSSSKIKPYTTSKVERSPIKQSAISSNGTEIASVNVIQSTKCLLEKTSFQVANNEPPLVIPEAFQSILNYSSDEEDYSSINNANNIAIATNDVNSDKKEIENTSSQTDKPLSVLSEFYDENEENNGDSSDSLPSTSDKTSTAPIIHRTLLTNKIAKITVISPLPNKNIKRKKTDKIGISRINL